MHGHSAYLKIKTTYGGVSYALPSSINGVYYSTFFKLLRQLSGWIYGFHMPLFFMLSGAVLALKPIEPLDKIAVKKIRHLLFPYFIYGLLFMLPVKFLGNFYDKAGLKQAITGFLSGLDSGHLWFLAALFWCMLCFVLVQKTINYLHFKSDYALLIISGVIQLTYTHIPFDVLLMKKGLSYIFWFALGYVFQKEKARNEKWNSKKLGLALLITFVIELIQFNNKLLNKFFQIACGSFFIFLLADVCERVFKNASRTKLWKIVIPNLFYVYLFHDPINYLVLRVFMNSNYMATTGGCCAYVFLRTIGIFLVSVFLGMAVQRSKNLVVKMLST